MHCTVVLRNTSAINIHSIQSYYYIIGFEQHCWAKKSREAAAKLQIIMMYRKISSCLRIIISTSLECLTFVCHRRTRLLLSSSRLKFLFFCPVARRLSFFSPFPTKQHHHQDVSRIIKPCHVNLAPPRIH